MAGQPVKKKVYLETSVVSYLTARPSRDLIRAARQQITREWWDARKGDFDLFVSQIVVDEATAGDPEAAELRAQLLADLPRLAITDMAVELARELIRQQALPDTAVEDALHIALAAVHGMDFLLTWNCSHIANAEMMGPIRSAILRAGFEGPWICTPEEMLGEWE
jgi:hypothetical protein